MLRLSRTVRFAINSDQAVGPVARGPNGYAGVPAMTGLGRHYELEVACRGEADPRTGYFINIKDIDAAVRATAIPAISQACLREPQADPAGVMRSFLPGLNAELHGAVVSVRWRLSPYYSLEMATTDTPTVLLRQRFEFAAAHRLHAHDMSDEENRRVFGKCNSPSGHGHNYIVEPCVATRLDDQGRTRLNLAALERTVNDAVIEKLDHKHLNTDVPQFDADRGGVNPSVENIAKVCFDLLTGPVGAAGGELRSVTVWETEKTSCTYPG